MPNIRVRIAVAVDDTGKWAAVGYKGMDDGDMYSIADDLSVNARYFWLESDLPLPVIETRTAQEMIEHIEEK